jgi:hypothetical protein
MSLVFCGNNWWLNNKHPIEALHFCTGPRIMDPEKMGNSAAWCYTDRLKCKLRRSRTSPG